MKAIKKKVKEIVCDLLDCKRISFRKDLRNIGLDSLSFTELIIRTEDELGVELFNDEITRFRNLKMFVIYVESKINDDERYL